MKIAVIGSKGLPPRQGGIEHHCAEIYPRMVSCGHSVTLFARASYTELPPYHVHDFQGVQVVSLPCLGVKGFDALVTSALAAIATSQTHYDIVHFHAAGPALFSWLPKLVSTIQQRFAKAIPPKIVVTCHGLDWKRAKWGHLSSRLLRNGESIAARFADELIVVSDDLQSYFAKTYGRQTVCIGNAPANYAASDPHFVYGTSLGLQQGRYVLFLGRLVPEKCPDLLIRAFQKLILPEWKLILVGGSSDTPAFSSQLTALAEGATNIIFAGELRGQRLAEIVRGAGLFALPSSIEGLPLAMLEAMKERIPVIASDIPAHKQLLDHERGILFQNTSVDSCAASLKWAIEHPCELQAKAEKAQQYVHANCSWDDITSDCLRVYGAHLAAPISETSIQEKMLSM